MTRIIWIFALSLATGPAAWAQNDQVQPSTVTTEAATATPVATAATPPTTPTTDTTTSPAAATTPAPTTAAAAATPSADENAAAANSTAEAATGQGLPTEVTIKASQGAGPKIEGQKPPLSVHVDNYATIRDDLKPDPSLLLAVAPLTVTWQKTHPDFLVEQRVIQPWRTSFGRGPGIVFDVTKELDRALGRHLEDAEAKRYGWTLTVADEAGRVFYRSAGPDSPPAQIVWSGENEDGEWIRAGHSYSAIYSFTAPDGSPYTIAGDPLLFHGILHQEATGLYISLDSVALFGKDKSERAVDASGLDLLRSAADLIKRGYSGIPLSVRVYAATSELGGAQAGAAAAYLERELMTAPDNVGRESSAAAFADQRVEIVVLNR